MSFLRLSFQEKKKSLINLINLWINSYFASPVQTVALIQHGPYLLQPGLWSRRGQIFRAEDLRTSGTSEESRNDAGLGPGVHLPNTVNTGLSCGSLNLSSCCITMNPQRRRYLLLCTVQHADGLDVIGVLSQSPLSFDSFIHSLTDVHRLQGQNSHNHISSFRSQSHYFNYPKTAVWTSSQ